MKTLKALTMAAKEIAAVAKQVTAVARSCGQQQLEAARQHMPAAKAYLVSKAAAAGDALREVGEAADSYIASKTVCIASRVHDARCGFPQAPVCTSQDEVQSPIETQ